MRVWLKSVDVPGLAMARSIGDAVSHEVGVIDVPEVRKFDMAGSAGFVVWASDGVYEFLESQDVCDLVGKTAPESLHDAAEKLVDKATNCWKAEEEVIDDITWYAYTLPLGCLLRDKKYTCARTFRCPRT